MSILFNQDNSTQLSYSNLSYTASAVDNYITSNTLITTSNQIINKINTDITTVNTNLSTNYYNKTSTDTLLSNKEQNLTFTAPLTRSTNTIGINLGSYYTSTQTDNFIATRQPTLTSGTSLLGNGNAITNINYNTVINKPTYISPLSINVSNQVAIDLSLYLPTTQTDARYVSLTTGGTISLGGLALTQGIYYGNGSGITNINYNNIPNRLTFLSPLSSNATNQISIDLSSYTNTTGMNTAISTALGSFTNTTGMNTAISTALGSYTNTTGMNTAISIGHNNTSNYISTKFLSLTGGTLTGDLIGTIGNFNKLTTVNNTGLANPVNGVSGGSGDRIILWSGSATQPPYSIGMSGNTLWLSSPNDIRFFNNAVQTVLIGNNGTFTIGNPTYQIYFNPPTATTPAGIQTIQQGLGFNQNLTLQAAGQGGKVGIGLNTPDEVLDVNGNIKCRGIMKYSNNLWNVSADGVNRTYYGTTNTSFYCCGADGTIGHAFMNSSYSVVLSILNNGNLSTTGNITCGGGMLLTGADAFYNTTAVTPANITNTFLTFRGSGLGNDWAYLRNIGGDESIKIALDFHDDIDDARFCIRKIQSTTNPDTVLEVFTVDNGNVSCTGTLNVGGTTTLSDALTVASYTNTKYAYLGGLRLAGWDYGNTIYQGTNDLGISVLSATQKITFNVFSGNGTIMDIKNDRINCYQPIFMKSDVWHCSADGAYRFYFGNTSGVTFIAGGNTDASGVCTTFMSGSVSGYTALMRLYNNGNIFMGDSSTNTAFLIVYGSIACRLFSTNKVNTDYVGTQGNRTQGTTILDTLCSLYDTFTGMHRCFTEDVLFNKEEPQKFKDDYVGRIVISSGKIATDMTNENNEWNIYYDKDGITPEDAVPMIELSRIKKDKRVFGVMGNPTRKNSRNERLIINSIGEGPILVCNSNGNIENGDYITSSDYLGYGEKQDDDLLHNYTVAKATIDCDFELDSPYYNCYEIDDLDADGNKLRVAFIACSYHCG